MDKWNVTLAIVPSLGMDDFGENNVIRPGHGRIMAEYLDFILNHRLDDPRIQFEGIRLLLWKCAGNPPHMDYSAPCRSTGSITLGEILHGRIKAFAEEHYPDPSVGDWEKRSRYLNLSDVPLCTGEALGKAMTEMCHDNQDRAISVLIVMTDNETAFDEGNLDGLPFESRHIPDLTVFVLPENVVCRASGLISRFNTPHNMATVFGLDEWVDDAGEAYCRAEKSAPENENNFIRHAAQTAVTEKYGSIYALYGLLKDVFNVERTHHLIG